MAKVFEPKILSAETVLIIPDPLTMQEIEYYENGKVKRIVFRCYADAAAGVEKAGRDIPSMILSKKP